MSIYELFRLAAWDERAVVVFRDSEKHFRRNGPWAVLPSMPVSPQISFEFSDDVMLLHPVGEVNQFELGAISAEFGLKITNARTVFDPLMPFRLTPMLGLKAWWWPNCWWRRVWISPVEIARVAQPHPDLWDLVREVVSEAPSRAYRISEINEMVKSLWMTKTKAHASTLTADERMKFWENYYRR